jgi:hypothetical protein
MMALILLLSVGGVFALNDLNADVERTSNVTAREQHLAGAVDAATSELTSLERGSVLAAMLGDRSHVDAYQQRFQARADSLQKTLSELAGLAGSPDEASRIQALSRQSSLVLQGHEELRQAIANQQMDAGLAIFGQKLQPQLEEIGRQASALVEQQDRSLAAISAAASSKTSRTRVFAVLLTLIALGVGGALLFLVHQSN